MNMLKIPELNLGFGDDKLGCLYDVLREFHPFNTALMQDLLTGKIRVTTLLHDTGVTLIWTKTKHPRKSRRTLNYGYLRQ